MTNCLAEALAAIAARAARRQTLVDAVLARREAGIRTLLSADIDAELGGEP